MRKLWLTVGMLVVLVPSLAFAATLRGSENGTVSISKDELIKNAYLAGEKVNIVGGVSQDLFAGGKEITVDGEVKDNIAAAGGTLKLNGPVGKSVRVAGGTITINNKVGSDLLVAGGTINVLNNTIVTDNAYIAGGEIHLDGKVLGSAYLTGGDITINSEITGDVIIRNGGRITIGDNARIGGKLDYTATEKANISSNAVISGETVFSQIKNKNIESNFSGAMTTSFSLFFALATLLLLVLIIYLLPKSSRKLLESSLEKPLENIGAGFVYLFIAPITAVILMITVLGLPIGLTLFGIYLVSIVIAKIFIPVVLGSLIYKLFKKENEYRLDWMTLVVGVVSTVILSFIPFVGWIIGFATFLLLLGVLTLNSFKALQLQQKR